MKKQKRDKILISFFREKEKYEKIAEFIVGLIRDDPSAPKESIHTILYRIKDESRLIEKIDQENTSTENDGNTITQKNFEDRVGDLIGIRIVCLRLSDIFKVEAYLQLLVEEKILEFMKEPDHKKSFVLPIDPGEAAPKDINLQYSGYSSVHYQVKLGEHSDASEAFKRIQAELQLRTILEEAWGEIDHKYRYAYSRVGEALPEHIHSGFYNLSAYLQAAAMQAEQLCREVEAHRLSKPTRSKLKKEAPAGSEHAKNKTPNGFVDPLSMPIALQTVLEEAFEFNPTARTITYIMKRFNSLGYLQRSKSFFRKLFKTSRLKEFRQIYQEVLKKDPFKDVNLRNVDIINAVNYTIFYETEGAQIAKEGLRATLKWRKDRSTR